MNRLLLLVVAVAFLNPHTLLAQRHGGRGAGGGHSAGGASGTDDLKDFKRALALQASPDQVAEFRRLTESTQAVRKSAQDLAKPALNASKSDLLLATNRLASALDTAQVDNQRFFKTFSDIQKSELKDLTKKLSKVNSEVTSQTNALKRDVERSRISDNQISGIAENLDRTLNEVQARQLAIGSEMGIQSAESSQ